MQLSESRKLPQALTEIDKAVKLDPNCDMALYWRGIILADIGDMDNALAQWEKIVTKYENVDEGEIPNIPVDAAINIGISYGKLKNQTLSFYFLSKAVILDMQDIHKEQWKAYRNMAISAAEEGDYLSATLQALKAKELAPSKVEDVFIKESSAKITDQTVVNMLHMCKEEVLTKHAVRSLPPSLAAAATIEGKFTRSQKVQCMARDASGRFIYVFYQGQPVADVFATDLGDVKQLALSNAVSCVASAGSFLYACRAGGASMDQLSLRGNVVRTYTLPGAATAIAVCPVTCQAFLSVGGKIDVLDLESGKTKETSVQGQLVVVDPRRQIIYATYKRTATMGSTTMIVNGRPVFLTSIPDGSENEDQDITTKAVYKRGGFVVLASIRNKAAWNSYTMDLSCDGKWITVTGGGGYRGGGGPGGYGTGVLASDALGKLEGFYATGPYSQTAVISPGCDQVAVVATGEMRVYNLGNSTELFRTNGDFCTSACWSGNGAYLLVARSDKGLKVFANGLSSEEKQKAATLADFHALHPRHSAYPAATAAMGQSPQKIAVLATFKPTSVLNIAIEHARKAVRSTRRDALPLWTKTNPYLQKAEVLNAVHTLHEDVATNIKDIGIDIYKTKKILKENPDFVPAILLLGQLNVLNGNYSEAIPLLIQTVQQDAGLSSLTTEALCALGNSYLWLKQEPESLDTLAAGLALDRANEEMLAEIKPLLEKYNIPFDEHAETAEVGSHALSGLGQTNVAVMTAAQIFEHVADKVVLITTDEGSGSGVCVSDRGHILTCNHVVNVGEVPVSVTLFEKRDGKLIKGQQHKAIVVFRDRDNDIALLRISDIPPTFRAVPISRVDPLAGSRVYAIGSPAMGSQILEETITDGIVSAADRVLENKHYFQHSAPINPGNSGGPLLSANGEIVGIVTLKANLQNVGFAIPASQLRSATNTLK